MSISKTLLNELNTALQAAAEPEFQARQQHYHKEEVQTLGVRTGTLRQIGKTFYPSVKGLPLEEFLDACESLLALGKSEYRCIGLAWAYMRRKELQPVHFKRLYHWLCKYVDSWSACDQLCGEVFGDFMKRYPQFAKETVAWARSENRWLRRAAGVVLIVALRKEATFLPILFQVATILLPDRDDLVQKGYGWALKEAMETVEAETFAFVMAHRNQMSRTALRYAIEKLSPEQRALAMQT
jgi:3-methyladenine DNA glycosylase AlkD